MIHIRTDREELNANATFQCGLKWPLPEGDKYFFEDEVYNWPHRWNRIDCHGCNPNGPKPLGTPISELSGRPGEPGYAEFCRIARSWGHD